MFADLSNFAMADLPDPRGSLGLEDSVLVPPMVDPWGPLGLELSW